MLEFVNFSARTAGESDPRLGRGRGLLVHWYPFVKLRETCEIPVWCIRSPSAGTEAREVMTDSDQESAGEGGSPPFPSQPHRLLWWQLTYYYILGAADGCSPQSNVVEKDAKQGLNNTINISNREETRRLACCSSKRQADKWHKGCESWLCSQEPSE